ncbi:MAG: response regulator [Phycisphaeraceae bacterium]
MQDKTILVADDEMHVTYILTFKLQRSGFRVITANDGGEAYRLACQHKPDIVITDFQMPVMNGFDMCVKLRENPETARIPVVMLTARGHKLSPTEMSRTNIQYLIPKPFSARELLAKIAEVLAQGGVGGVGSGYADGSEEAGA